MDSTCILGRGSAAQSTGFWAGEGNVLVVVCVDSLFGLLIFVVFFLACGPETLKILNAASTGPRSLRDQCTFCLFNSLYLGWP